jgi:hypothetical protein
LGSSDDIWEFYTQRFKNIQQNARKLVAKSWIKALAPNKKVLNPYAAGDEKAPNWWLKPWGPSKDKKVRHVDPDHVFKERFVFPFRCFPRNVPVSKVCSILTRHQQSEYTSWCISCGLTIQAQAKEKHRFNVSELEELTMSSLSSFFSTKSNNVAKRPYLKEIFKVAKYE